MPLLDGEQLLPARPHRQHPVPLVSRDEIEWQMARAEVRSMVGEELPAMAHRFGMTPGEALNHLTAGPRWLLAKQAGVGRG
ncbi:hypothetical protein [Streptomyces sp. NBC_01174]|uniref:hypothetical protein n=1 Tax=Streptomyces sp. NBC_01174 TaxID=2903758 RepID=UPI003869B596|nr:hypothetical protein OG414_40720 [Streptomyces sp. NBC_01174]